LRGEVLACGDELLHGGLLDTNSKYIAAELEAAGLPVHRFTVLGDEPEGLRQGIAEACARSEVVVLTGGLGPTLDDRTRDVAAELCGGLQFHDDSWQQIQAFMRARGRPVPDSNRRQAMFPKGASPLANPVGTAPGFRVAIGRANLFALPGVPREMHRMLADHVLPFVRALPAARPTAAHFLRIVGPSEALLGERLEPWMAPGRDPAVGITASYGMLTVRVVGTGTDAEQAKTACLQVAAELRPLLGTWIIAEGNDDLAMQAGRRLIERGITFGLAESCTGGLVAGRLTEVPGISAVFRGGFVTYADEAKVRHLGVDASLLAQHGAVSEPVAMAMAEGACRALSAELGLAITGIAGPGGGTPEKPVGTVCFGLCRAGKAHAFTVRIPDFGREFVRERAVVEALVALLRAGEKSA
jgi:nicotinamide-nucleotide amidase